MTAYEPLPGSSSTARAANPPPKVRTPGAFVAIYRLFLRNQVTLGRVIAVLAIAALGILIALATGVRANSYPIENGAHLIDRWGLTVMVPVISLVFASSSLGDLIDDKTLVYLWLKPVNRYLVAAAAAAAALTICIPAVVAPIVVMAILTRGGISLVEGATVASLVGVIAYVAMFLALGLRFKRALVWGLIYIVLWEGFVATASKTANRLAIRCYTRSVLSEYTGVGFSQASQSLVIGIVVPIVVAGVFVGLTGHRLSRTIVD